MCSYYAHAQQPATALFMHSATSADVFWLGLCWRKLLWKGRGLARRSFWVPPKGQRLPRLGTDRLRARTTWPLRKDHPRESLLGLGTCVGQLLQEKSQSLGKRLFHQLTLGSLSWKKIHHLFFLLQWGITAVINQCLCVPLEISVIAGAQLNGQSYIPHKENTVSLEWHTDAAWIRWRPSPNCLHFQGIQWPCDVSCFRSFRRLWLTSGLLFVAAHWCAGTSQPPLIDWWGAGQRPTSAAPQAWAPLHVAIGHTHFCSLPFPVAQCLPRMAVIFSSSLRSHSRSAWIRTGPAIFSH